MPRKLIILIPLTTLLLAGAWYWERVMDAEVLRHTLADQLSTALGRQVAIDRANFGLAPFPSLNLHAVQMALDGDSRLEVKRIDIDLDWRAMLHGEISVCRLNVAGVVLDRALAEGIRKLAEALVSSMSSSPSGVGLREFRLTDAFWSTNHGHLTGPFEATVKLIETETLHRVAVKQGGGNLEAELKVQPIGIEFVVTGNNWPAPFGAGRRLEHFFARGLYSEGRIDLEYAEIGFQEGELHGSAILAWPDGWHIEGFVTASRLSPQLFTSSFGVSTIEHPFEGKCALVASAAAPTDLWRRPSLDCTFVYSADKSSRLTFTTDATNHGLSYSLEAENIDMPTRSSLESLRARGTITDNQVSLDELHLKTRPGTLNGRATLAWGRQWNLSFDTVTHGFQIAPLLSVFKKRSLDGKLNSRCSADLTVSRHPGVVLRKLSCDFDIRDGEIYDTDLETTARLLKTEPQKAASTPFDLLTGTLQADGAQWRFSTLRLTSKALEASGELRVDTKDNLSGEIAIGLRNTAGLMAVPLLVEGTVQAPVIRPKPSALAGGAAGTLLLGPGLGTAIGVKAGEAVEKATRWFRPKKETKDD